MARMVQCIKLGKEAEGLTFPLPRRTRQAHLAKCEQGEAWAGWIKHQTMLVNENRLNLADAQRASTWRARWNSTSLAAPVGARLLCRPAPETGHTHALRRPSWRLFH